MNRLRLILGLVLEGSDSKPELAARDLTTAIELGLKGPAPFDMRGVAKFALGDLYGALEDFDQAIRNANGASMPYAWLMRSLVMRRLDLAEPFDELNEQSLWWGGGWQAAIADYLTGKKPEEDLMDTALHLDAVAVNNRLCENYFYVGMAALAGGDMAKAQRNFEQCVGVHLSNYKETHIAEGELKRLGVGG